MAVNSLKNLFQSRVHDRSSFYLAGLWSFFIVATAGGLAAGAGHLGTNLAVTLCVLAAFVAPYMGLGLTSSARDIGPWLRHKPVRLFYLGSAVVTLYLAYGASTGSLELSRFLKLACFTFAPLALVFFAGTKATSSWLDWLAAIIIWIPFDARWLTDIWQWPAGNGAYVLNTILAVDLALLSFLCFRRIPGLNFRFTFSKRDLLLGLGYFGIFALVAIPIGLASGFISWNPERSLLKWILTPIGIFLFIAIPEELLFRGIFQNLLSRLIKGRWASILIISGFFGLTHLNNGGGGDWRYVGLATFAGVIYGKSYITCRGLLIPALIHTAVDSVWILLFFNGIR